MYTYFYSADFRLHSLHILVQYLTLIHIYLTGSSIIGVLTGVTIVVTVHPLQRAITAYATLVSLEMIAHNVFVLRLMTHCNCLSSQIGVLYAL